MDPQSLRDELDELGRRLHKTGEAVRALALDGKEPSHELQALWHETDLIRARLYELHLLTRQSHRETCALH